MRCVNHPKRVATARVRLTGSPLLRPICASCHEEFVVARYPRSGRAAEIIAKRGHAGVRR